jgi:SHS2 domain-containing protein
LSYRYLAHTADLRAALDGTDLAALYQSAADLVREILVGGSDVATAERRCLAVEGGEEAERFFRFVRGLLFLYDCEGFLPARVAGARGRGEVRSAGAVGVGGKVRASGEVGVGGKVRAGGEVGASADAGAGGEVCVHGELFDPARHASEHQVKAVTRHGYRFERTPAGYEAELLFDL